MKGFFITATDTGVGKTYIATAMIHALKAKGIAVTPRKPVETGCKITEQGLEPQDGKILWQAVNPVNQPEQISLDKITPYRFKEAVSPYRASLLENKPLNIAMLINACRAPKEGILLVEGAGGFYSPICNRALNADLAQTLGLPIILVAANRLGTIHQVLVTLEAINRRGLTTAAVILNHVLPEYTSINNQNELKDFIINIPIITSPFSKEGLSDLLIKNLTQYVL